MARGGWLYTRNDLDSYLDAARIQPGDLAHLGKPNQGGRYRGPGSSHTPQR